LTQHQHAFAAEDPNQMTRVARHVLSVLASKDDCRVIPAAQQDEWGEVLDRLLQTSLNANPTVFEDAIKAVQSKGFEAPQIAFDMIPVIARQLGNAWEDDVITFADVTLGCARLQRAVHQLTDDVSERLSAGAECSNCLVILPDGAQHTLGAIILAKQLRLAGMDVTLDLAATPDALVRYGETQSFDSVLLSASLSETSDSLRALVVAARREWPDSKVILGGSFQDHAPSYVLGTGVDYVTQDWQEALELCI